MRGQPPAGEKVPSAACSYVAFSLPRAMCVTASTKRSTSVVVL
jgi:hypothetical protein